MGYANNTNVGTGYRNPIIALGPSPTFSGTMQGGDYSAGAGNYIGWLGRSRMRSNADGFVTLYNNAESDFTGLRFGGVTNLFPMLKRSATGLIARLADDSGNAPFTFSTITHTISFGGIYVGSQYTGSGSTRLDVSVDGILKLLNDASTGFSRMQFGGSSASFPGLRRTGTALDVVLADASDYATINAGVFCLRQLTKLNPVSDGVLYWSDSVGTNFTRMGFGGSTASYPALGRSGTQLQCLLADGSGYASFIGAGLYSVSASAGVGYSAGAGGTVTQGAGSGKATGFTLSRVTGQITTDNALLAASTTVSATWTNTILLATDTVVINHVSGGTPGAYTFNVQCGTGTATLNIRNISLGALTEALVLNFTVIRGVIV